MKMWTVLIPVLLVLAFPAFASPSPADPQARLVRSDDRGFEVELTFPEPAFLLKKYEGQRPIHQVSIEGLGYLESEGKAMVPVKGLLVGLPPEGEPTVEVVDRVERAIPGRYTLYPSPSYPPAEGKNGGCKNICGDLFESFRLDRLFYSSRDLYPASTVERGFTGYLRDQRVAQLRVYPIRYNPAAGEVLFTSRLRLRVDYHFSGPARAGAPARGGERLAQIQEDALRATLVNYEQAARWERPRAAGVEPAKTWYRDRSGSKGAGDLKITIAEPGIYRLTYNDLKTAGLDPDVLDPRALRLMLRDQEVRIYVAGEDDGVFDPQDYIEFWAEPLKGRYSYVNVYWLLNGGVYRGLRMLPLNGEPGGAAVPEAFLETMHFEENNHWYPGLPTWQTTEFWEWALLRAPQSFSAPFALSGLSTLPRVATLRVRLQGKSAFSQNPDHHTKIYLNGVEVDDLYWDGQVEFTHEVAVPMDTLIEGQNVLTVVSPGDTGAFEDEVYLNWFEVDAWKVYRAQGDSIVVAGQEEGTAEFRVTGFAGSDLAGYDVAEPLSPRRIVNAQVLGGPGDYEYRFDAAASPDSRFAVLAGGAALSPLAMAMDVPSDLHGGGAGADYLILTVPAFDAAALRLAALRASQGMRTAIVHTEDVYDEFNYGIPDPQAVRDFLAYAYANWTAPALSYVLLLGDSHPDYDDYLNSGKPIHVPSMLIGSPEMGATPSDIPYSQIVGNDPLPDLYLGRVPAESLDYAQAQVDKILDYESRAAEPWNKNATFVADNNYPAFETTSESLAALVPHDFTIARMYLGFNDPAVIRDGLLGLFDAGQLLVTYVGHGNVEGWAGESIFTSDDAYRIRNGARMPFVMSYSCLNGYFPIIEPRKALAEAFLVPPDGDGAIATLAPSGFTLRYDNDLFAGRVFNSLFPGRIKELGPAINAAKIYAYSNLGVGREIIDLYHLLGDPAVDLKIQYPPVTNATAGGYAADDDQEAPTPAKKKGCGSGGSSARAGCGMI